MNTQIKQLADHCWSHRVDGVLIDGHLHFDYEKFAELIVRECVEVVKWTPSIFPNDPIIKNIKEHFGVEE
jgi:hypothetical protein